MEFGFTKEQEKLREEVRNFFMDELPEDYDPSITPMNEELQAFFMGLQKKAGEKGYLTPGWPKEYGGLGLSDVGQGIVDEERARASVTWPNNIGLAMAGPATILFGTEEQKKKFIPPITRGEVVWFQAFTEPEAGSDEANQQTRAVQDGDYFIINGQKTFISGIYKPDFLYTEVRTLDVEPKHRGLSLFLIPADLPGITYRPLPTMSQGVQNEIFFDDVRVHKDYLLGEMNRGFYHAMATFEFERSGTGFPAAARRGLEEFVQYCKEERRDGKPLFDDPEVRKTLARIAVEQEVHRLVAWHTVWWFSQRDRLGPVPYDLTGFFQKVFTVKHAEEMGRILGPYQQLRTGSKHAKYEGRLERSWQVTRSLHAGGTWEVNKIVLAGRGLGLPRIPRKLHKEITKALSETR